MEIAVPIRRIGEGFYLFGTRKIFAKVLNNKLVVRVGGGFMSFSEFIDCHALIELKKIQELQANGEWDLEKFIQGTVDNHSPEKRKSAMGLNGSPSRGPRSSPNATQGPSSRASATIGRSSPTATVQR